MFNRIGENQLWIHQDLKFFKYSTPSSTCETETHQQTEKIKLRIIRWQLGHFRSAHIATIDLLHQESLRRHSPRPRKIFSLNQEDSFQALAHRISFSHNYTISLIVMLDLNQIHFHQQPTIFYPTHLGVSSVHLIENLIQCEVLLSDLKDPIFQFNMFLE